MTASQKDVIYIDIDDDITAIIDKVKSSPKKIVALVLPKRATGLQSTVNMKLLKRATDESAKNLVLITSESALMPLAGVVGLHVAKTLQSKPVVPAAPIDADTTEADGAEITEEDFALEDNANKPVGELSGSEPDETIEVDNDQDATLAAASSATAKAGKKKAKTGKKFKIPDFDKFRTRLVLGGAALLLVIVGWYVAFHVLPKATVTVRTDTTSVSTDFAATARLSDDELNEEQAILPAKNQELRKTDTEKTAATGQKDVGTKASGTVSLKNCTKSDGSVTIPAGTGVSTNNLTYITQQAVKLPESTFSGSDRCTTATEDVPVTAQSAGDKYNLSGGRTFTVSGYSSVSGSDSSQMSGGTSKVVKVVTQNDIENAKAKVLERNNTSAKEEITKTLNENGYVAIDETLTAGTPSVTSSPNVDTEANDVTVNVTTTFSMAGVKRDDLKTLITKAAKDDIDESKQVVVDDGVDQARLQVTSRKPNEIGLQIATTVVAGPDLNTDAVKAEVIGKKKGDAISALQARPGIKEVDIRYSPFWIYSTPKKASKINVQFEQNNTNAN